MFDKNKQLGTCFDKLWSKILSKYKKLSKYLLFQQSLRAATNSDRTNILY